MLTSLPGPPHGTVHAIAQNGSILLRAVVILPCRYIACAAGEVNLKHLHVFVLTLLSSQTAKIACDPAIPVVAHRVRGIVMHGYLGFIALPKADGLQPGVNQAFRRLTNLGILGRTIASELNLPIL